MFVLLAVIGCKIFIGCSDNNLRDVSFSDEENFEMINYQIDSLNEKYSIKSTYFTRNEEEKEDDFKFWKIAKEDLSGAATGGALGGTTGALAGSIVPGIGTTAGGLSGIAVGSIIYGTVYSMSEYEEQKEDKKKEDDKKEDDKTETTQDNVNMLYPIRNITRLVEIDNLSFTNAGYYHNEIIKSCFMNIFGHNSSSFSLDELFYAVCSIANYESIVILSEEDTWYLNSNLYKFIDFDIYNYEECAYPINIMEEASVIRSYFDAVRKLNYFEQVYRYTVDFMSIIYSRYMYDPNFRNSASIINSAISVCIYSKLLWNLNIPDPLISTLYPVFSIERGMWVNAEEVEYLIN